MMGMTQGVGVIKHERTFLDVENVLYLDLGTETNKIYVLKHPFV